ncbi:NDMA-dependent alcohol dehydrogenase [Jatrophihabitans sp.]|uniref:NDMA-dependent alcohol dehydrogenase n=1 Tax=Jatrophihabitans sp. TaxID=1932789 RepID=UPI0030C76A7D|nr:NDMA-dependent alcohol dehydrogenase [Jatrophihabitans sp.]
MHVQAATLWGVGQQWSVEDVELGDPGNGEVLVKVMATGLCHSDDHAVTGDSPTVFPIIGGHEGAGIVEAIGPNVTHVAVGDHIVLAFNPPCGRCSYCAGGQSNFCAMSRMAADGSLAPSRFTIGGAQAQAMAGLGTFSPYTVVPENSVITMPHEVPFEAAALLGCAVTTGWGSAVHLAEVRPGDNVIVIGAGGIGVNAIQGAMNAGADVIVAVDTAEFKREQALQFGASHCAASVEEAMAIMREETNGRLADATIIAVGVGNPAMLSLAVDSVGLGGTVVIASVTPSSVRSLDLSLFAFTLSQKTIRGNVYGGVNVHKDIPVLLGLYRRGRLKLDELVTTTYPLAEINTGYTDMFSGRNLRGVVVHEH